MYMMGYLKGFNEGNITDEFLSVLQDFCEMNLVYLMDDGLQVSVGKHSVSREDMDTTYLSCVTLRYPLAAGTFELLVQKDWNSVKDHIIPFFTRLNSQYNVITFDQLPIANSASLLGKVNNGQVQFGLRRTTVVNPGLTSGGFRKNFTIDDVISDRLDLGNNLIVEIRFYVSCNDDVPLPVKKSIGSRVKGFLGFNESVGSFSDNLQDFCNQYLAYLLDEGFSVTLDNKFQDFYTIRLSLGTVNYNWVDSDAQFLWDSVKDHYVPFLQMLARAYDLKDFAGGKEVFFITGDHRHQNKLSYYDDVVSGVDDQSLGQMVLGGIIVMVGTSERSLTAAYRDSRIVESSLVDLQDELDDICDTCLSPLVDDGFTYEVTSTWNGEFDISLSMESNGIIPELYDYTEVMDRFIPFVRILSTRYDMSEWIYFYTTQEWDINKKVFSVEQICADKGPGFLVNRIKLTVKGRKD